jgi:hypothetical protein
MSDNNTTILNDDTGIHPVEELKNFHGELASLAKNIDNLVTRQTDPMQAAMLLSKQTTGNLMPLLQDIVASLGSTLEILLEEQDGGGLLDQDTVADIGIFLLSIIKLDDKIFKKPETLEHLKAMAKELAKQITDEVPDFEEMTQAKMQMTLEQGASEKPADVPAVRAVPDVE